MDKKAYERLAAHAMHEATDTLAHERRAVEREKALEAENAALRAKCAEYETLLGVRLREIKAALEGDDNGQHE